MYPGKNRGVHTDADAEGPNHDGRCQGHFEDHPPGVTHVGPQAFQQPAGARIADRFFHLLDASQLHQRLPMGCPRVEPLAYFFLFQKLEIGAHFGVELLFDTILAEEIAPEIQEATHVDP